MATREEWVRHFEDVNGRKPSPEEFMEAKKEGFGVNLPRVYLFIAFRMLNSAVISLTLF